MPNIIQQIPLEAEKPVRLNWRVCARRLLSHPVKTAVDIATYPAVLFNAGSTIRAFEIGGIVGQIFYVAATALSIGFRAYESVTGEERGVPFLAQAVVNLAMAGSTFGEGVATYGLSHMLDFASAALVSTTTAAAYTVNGVGCWIKSVHDEKKTKPGGPFSDEITYFAAADALIVDNKWLMPLFGLGLAKAIYDRRHPVKKVRSVKSYALKHITFERLGAIAFFAGAASTVALDWKFALAQLAWGVGYNGLDQKKNRQWPHDTRMALTGKRKNSAFMPK